MTLSQRHGYNASNGRIMKGELEVGSSNCEVLTTKHLGQELGMANHWH